jgi:hypothetical protein
LFERNKIQKSNLLNTSWPTYLRAQNDFLNTAESKLENTASCQRCGDEIQKGKVGTISYRDNTFHFCERCFKAVFKYDPSMRTVDQIYRDNGKTLPFIVRSSNWHKSTYMQITDAKVATAQKSGAKQKVVYVGDFYLRGELKEQNHVVGKANHFIWTPWSAELAQKYKEPVPEASEVPIEVTQ